MMKQVFKNKLYVLPALVISLFLVFTYYTNTMAADYEIENIICVSDNDNQCEAYQKSNWQKYYQLDEDLNTRLLEQKDLPQEYKENLELNQKYAKYMFQYQNSYDDRFNLIQGISYCLEVLKDYGPILIIVFLSLIFSRIYCFQYKDRLDIYKILPISREKKVLIQSCVGFLIGIITILFIVLVSVLCSAFSNTVGSMDTPVLIYESMSYVSFSTIVLPMILLMVFSVLFIIESILFISNIVRKGMSVLLIVCILCIGMIFMTTWLVPLFPFIHFLPTTYIQFVKVITGELSYLTNNENVNFINGILVLGGWNVILFLLSWCLEKRRWIKC